MGGADVQHAMFELARRLESLGIPYAIAGGMAPERAAHIAAAGGPGADELE